MGEILARGIAFVGMLLVARRLGPTMYGIIGVASGLLLYFNQVADAGIELSGIPVMARSRERASAVASATLTWRIMLGMAVTVLVAGVGVALLPQPDGSILAIYALSLVPVAAGTRWILLGFQRPAAVAIARVVGEVTGLAILIVVIRDAGDAAIVPLAFVVGAALSAILMLVGVRRLGLDLFWNTDWSLCRDLFVRAPHLVGYSLLGLVLFNFDLIYLRYLTGSEAAGYYAAAYTFIAFAANVSVAWSHSVMPALARLETRPEERDEVYESSLVLGFAVTLPVAVGGLAVAGSLIDLFFGSGYEPAARVLLWLLPAVPVSAMREVVVSALLGSPGGERRLLRINITSVVINVALVVPVVPVFGMEGAAAATLVTEIVRCGIALWQASLSGFSLHSVRRFFRPVIASLAMLVALHLLGERSLPVLVAAGAATYSVALWLAGGIVMQAGRLPRLRL